ncbi:dTDP-4-dehydrorhamnose 3,5-epimerase and related enzyme [Magnetospirillum sp. XM-1]|uniref:dTDP-4-dehydrorhamnose 3,5-epimerase n=1 Tax=Magnetospirillum sp. XM-1 TaxID=1663591 RepID=UPI00073DCD19|nr:dTDP-4-dehydrorhamnose 3,5-epimerase [Magnetospirillum sp. XM-1]CUW37980.1 dTDP-4-dehydrorhamnose 3,5-epimerase and related enzyme [Magnetospirillum sp. XM-1]
MHIESTALSDVLILEPRRFHDERGTFFDALNPEICAAVGMANAFVQHSHSISRKGTVRGLHIQLPRTQGKLVRVVGGSVFDVVADVRPQSPTFGRHIHVVLSAGNRRMLWIGRGLAHGFMALEDNSEMIYALDDVYDPGGQWTIRWNDPDLAIAWPDLEPNLSPKDEAGLTLAAFRAAAIDGRPAGTGDLSGRTNAK